MLLPPPRGRNLAEVRFLKNKNHSGGLRDFKLNFRNQGGGCADLISNAPSLTVLKYYTNARARAPWARLMLSAALKRAAASRSAHGVHTQHTREGFKETHSHTSSCSAYMSSGASSSCSSSLHSRKWSGRLHGRHQRAVPLLILGRGCHGHGAATAPSVPCARASSEVFFVLIHNIIKIRIIHNTRRFPLYYATLEGPGAPDAGL